MLHTAHYQVRTVYHTAVANLDSSLWVSYGGFIADLNLIIIVKVLLFVVTVLRFHVRQDKRKMGTAVTVTADSSLNGSRSKQIKISVPSDQEVNMKDLLLKCRKQHLNNDYFVKFGRLVLQQ